MEYGRDEPLEDANVRVMAAELDRLLDRHQNVMDFNDKLDAANILRKDYATKVKAMDHVFLDIIPKYEELRRDRRITSLAHRFMDFSDRYNKGDFGGVEFDVHQFQGASLNEVRSLIKSIVREMMGS